MEHMTDARLITQPQTEKKIIMPFATTWMELDSLILRENLTLTHTISIATEQNPKHDPPPISHPHVSPPERALHC